MSDFEKQRALKPIWDAVQEIVERALRTLLREKKIAPTPNAADQRAVVNLVFKADEQFNLRERAGVQLNDRDWAKMLEQMAEHHYEKRLLEITGS